MELGTFSDGSSRTVCGSHTASYFSECEAQNLSELIKTIYLANLSGARVSVTITRDNTVFTTAPDDIIAVHSGTASYESQLERAIERIQIMNSNSTSLPDPVVPALFSGAK